MDTMASSSKFIFFFIICFIFLLCSSGSYIKSDGKDIRPHKASKRRNTNRRELIQTIQHDFAINPPFTAYPATPVTNPVTTPSTGAATTPPDTTMPPPIITVPPAVDPTNPPIPVTNPVTTPSTGAATTPPDTTMPPPIITVPPALDPTNPPIPVTNPVTTPSTTLPVPAASTPTFSSPAVAGQSWCVARGGVPESVIQVALDYACGIGGADCSAIQQGQSCYNPNTLENHASFAFNSYFQKNPVQTSCDFGGAAMITNVNPSSGSCIFPTWSSSSASPATVSPATTTPVPNPDTYGAVPVGSGSPPTVMNSGNPALGGGFPPTSTDPTSTSSASASASASSSLKLSISCITVLVSIIIGTSCSMHSMFLRLWDPSML